MNNREYLEELLIKDIKELSDYEFGELFFVYLNNDLDTYIQQGFFVNAEAEAEDLINDSWAIAIDREQRGKISEDDVWEYAHSLFFEKLKQVKGSDKE